MDDARFDALSRALAARLPRRGALGLLAALGLAGTASAGNGAGGRDGGKEHGRNRGHRPGKGKDNRKGKRKGGGGRPPGAGPTYYDCADPANHGRPCGRSSHPRGGTLRCCHGECPDRDCIPTGFTGVRCSNDGDCGGGYGCCSTYGGCEAGENQCVCDWSEPGTDCGSDVDCAYVGQICVCGGCQYP